MAKPASPEWFLDVEGNKSGPFSAEQIRGLLESGQVQPQHRVTAARLKGDWISVDELVQAFKAALSKAAVVNQTPPKPFEPPPRPVGIENHETHEPSYRRMDDATRDLFDALQAARERKTAAKLTAPHAEEWGKHARSTGTGSEARQSAQLWFIAAMALLLGGTVWGIVRLLPHNDATVAEKSSAGAHPTDTRHAGAAPATSTSASDKKTVAIAPAPTVIAPPHRSLIPMKTNSGSTTTTTAGSPYIRPAPPIIQPPRPVTPPRSNEDYRRDDREDRRAAERDDRDNRDDRENTDSGWSDRSNDRATDRPGPNDDRPVDKDPRDTTSATDRVNAERMNADRAAGDAPTPSGGFPRSGWNRDDASQRHDDPPNP